MPGQYQSALLEGDLVQDMSISAVPQEGQIVLLMKLHEENPCTHVRINIHDSG